MKSYIKEINDRIINGNESIHSIVYEYVNIIKAKDKEINSVLELYNEDFINAQIEAATKMISDNKHTLLTGIPIVLKDNLCVDGQIASAGSKILENYRATYNSTVAKRLQDAGAILVGRSNMDEFAMGSSTENSAYGPTFNPLNISTVPGGSSGGSAAVVAYGGVPVSIGSDTGGSIRQPASFTGLVGLKPTYGAVSRYGLMAMGSSLDIIGPLARTVEDARIVYDIIKGEDKKDATATSNEEKDKNITPNGKVIGVPFKFINKDGVDNDVRENFMQSLEILKAKGYKVKEIEINNIELSLSVYYILMFAEVSSNLSRYDGVRYGHSVKGETPNESMILSRSSGLGREPQRRTLLGTYVLSAGYYDEYYYKAIKARESLKREFAKAFKDVDYIATPTSPILAWKQGEKNDPLSMYLADIFTVPANIVGVPGISLPTGTARDNLKYGVQFLASWDNEDKLFTIGYDLE